MQSWSLSGLSWESRAGLLCRAAGQGGLVFMSRGRPYLHVLLLYSSPGRRPRWSSTESRGRVMGSMEDTVGLRTLNFTVIFPFDYHFEFIFTCPL